MKINVWFYHGTDAENVPGILEQGFLPDTNSCATMDKEWAYEFGNALIKFKYPVSVTWKNLRYFLYDYFYEILVIDVSGFKPKGMKINIELKESQILMVSKRNLINQKNPN